MEKISPEKVIEAFRFSTPIQVRYSDIDGYMHVNNGVYFAYLEHVRALYLHQVCGWDIMETGTVVANINLDFLKPIHVFDQPQGHVRCARLGNSSFVLEQVIMGQTEQFETAVFALAATTMVSVDMKTMKPVPIPDIYAKRIRDWDRLTQ
ncbi:acyl-CoA thioesterase [Pararhodonellum marinum]|uniref:acyl-CoA thioesterase n=1 Tax=Pararhodonellum marinum TaxID=2755358 RepID=UPI001890407F|nr:thioesterase family protein [Pararhodonellum marinum]